MEEDAAVNFIDLSTIPEPEHRNHIVGNALLFVIARNLGLQCVEMFLAALYAKWLGQPIFGRDSARRAEEQIRNFGKYLHGMANEEELNALLARALGL